MGKTVALGSDRICSCPPNHLNCMTAKEWLKSQIGVWQCSYEKRDIRDKTVHPATFPLALARKIIELFTHEGELVLDPFVGSGTSLLAAQDTNRNAIGFDINPDDVAISEQRLRPPTLFQQTQQLAILDDANHIPLYLQPNTVRLIWTSPPYANMLNRKRKNKSRHSADRHNAQYDTIEQYSQDSRDLGTMTSVAYTQAVGAIFEQLLPFLKPKAHCVINIADMWWENERIPLHSALIEELRQRGYEFRNTIIWDRTNLVNGIGIFGWPSNYITMGTTFEYLLDFWKPSS